MDPNERAAKGKTALHKAILDGHTELAAMLLKAGADIDARDEGGETPLHDAVISDVEVTRLLLDNGADVNATREADSTALEAAANFGEIEIMTLLIERGADVHHKDKFGRTAMFWCKAGRPNVDCIRLFQERGVK